VINEPRTKIFIVKERGESKFSRERKQGKGEKGNFGGTS